MFSLKKFGRKSLITAGVVAISCGTTYYISEIAHEAEIADLQSQVSTLNDKVLQARVTQRVSEQMEEIASQQSEISNQERDKAEKQKHIADIERGKAEIERGLAMEAQQKALSSAEEAKKAQGIAETQSKLATENMLMAQDAKAHTDTLMYLSLANSLAQSSLTLNGIGNTDLSRLLALASWHYSNAYKGDPSTSQNIFQSLFCASGTLSTERGMLKGNVRKVRICDDGVIAVTDYGEVFYNNDGQNYVVNLGKMNFRDMYSYGKKRTYALCADGTFIEIDLTNIDNPTLIDRATYSVVLQLPPAFWKRLISVDDGNTIIAMADDMIAWIDMTTMTVSATAKTEGTTTGIGHQENILHVFCEGDIHYVSEEAGQLIPIKLATMDKENVTAYTYNKKRHLQVIGLSTGAILIYNDQGELQCRLLGHSGPITELRMWDVLLGSTSYDSSIRLWNITNLSGLVTSINLPFDQWPLTFDVNKNENMVWIGTEKGLLPHFCSNIILNAQHTQEKLTREFTPKEWKYYVGNGIEQIKFMK